LETIPGETLSPDSNLINILCVALHYSERYGNSEEFLNKHMNDTAVYRHITYLSYQTPIKLIDTFCEDYFRQGDRNISWKNMQYLWEHYLGKLKLPTVMFMQNLKVLLKNRLTYSEELDSFIGITSNYLPELDRFLRFWNGTMTYGGEDGEYEIGELCALFTKWMEQNSPDAKHREKHISEKKMKELIAFYFPVINMDGKHVYGVECSLWNKSEMIMLTLELFRNSRYQSLDIVPYITLSELYNWYCTY
jgi:hypothetical protein